MIKGSKHLVDVPESHRDITLFESELAPSEYTQESGTFFPKENAYVGDLLEYLRFAGVVIEPKDTERKILRYDLSFPLGHDHSFPCGTSYEVMSMRDEPRGVWLASSITTWLYSFWRRRPVK